ncbi:MAG: translation elongation factor Ts [Phycisphaerae bacterium]|nr:translation elongation factor Ts [Phycisphaerae bacterium]
MAEITAASVMKLRNMSGQGMMDCKKALAETDGDVDKAMELLRKKGLATLAKRSEREASEGIAVCKASEDGKTVAMATLCCETDFVAKSEGFVAAANRVADYAMACDASEGIDALLATTLDGKSLQEMITDLVSQTGEKTEVGNFARFKVEGAGLICTYIHFNGKVGAMVRIETSNDSVAAAECVKATASDICMHISAVKPLALDKSGIDPGVVAKERDIYAEQVKNKPAEIIDKIVDGKMGRFYADNCLLQQPFVKDDKKTVEQVLSEAAKQAGGEAKLVQFVRFEVGQ